MNSPDDLAWILNHLGEDRATPGAAVAPPIAQSSNFGYPDVKTLRRAIADEYGEPFYTRGHNPTVATLRQKLAALERTEDALVFASGSAAIAAAVITFVGQGDHVICVAKPYGWTAKLLTTLLSRFGVEHDFVDGTKVANFEAVRRDNTRLVILESPNSLTFEQQPLAEVSSWARGHKLVTLCDNSYASPLLQRPAEHGIDLIAHSATKYLNGHGDVVAGVICGNTAHLRQIFYGPYMTLGATLQPFEAWLMLRGLRTLPLRIERVSTTASKVATWLNQHPRVDRVYTATVNETLAAVTGLLSFSLRGDRAEEAERLCNRLQRFVLACSWGSHESLALPSCAFIDATGSKPEGGVELPASLIRLSIGLEDSEVLIADLSQALARRHH